jgi:hypothetical protein
MSGIATHRIRPRWGCNHRAWEVVEVVSNRNRNGEALPPRRIRVSTEHYS